MNIYDNLVIDNYDLMRSAKELLGALYDPLLKVWGSDKEASYYSGFDDVDSEIGYIGKNGRFNEVALF